MSFHVFPTSLATVASLYPYALKTSRNVSNRSCSEVRVENRLVQQPMGRDESKRSSRGHFYSFVEIRLKMKHAARRTDGRVQVQASVPART